MFTAFQIFMIILIWLFYSFEGVLFGILFSPYGSSILLGTLTGLVLGDVKTGLLIGGTLELMGIGLNPLGGSSVPNYALGATIGTAFAIVTGTGMEIGIATAVPVATLGVQLDVLGNAVGSFFLHKAMKANEEKDLKNMYQWIHLGLFPKPFLSIFSVLLLLFGGSAVVQFVLDVLPVGVLNGFSNAGTILPALGFAILLRSLPIKDNFMYVLIGFVLAAYLNVPILGIAILGFTLAWIAYKNSKKLSLLKAGIQGIGDEDDD